MCSSDAFKNLEDYSRTKVRTDLDGMFNLKKNPGEKLKNKWNSDSDFNNKAQAEAEERKDKRKLTAQTTKLNNSVAEDAAPGTFFTADDSFVTDKGAIRSKRRQSSLLTEPESTSLLG